MKSLHFFKDKKNTVFNNLDSAYKAAAFDITAYGQQLKDTRELINYSFILTNPRNRIIYSEIRKASPFYYVGELAWYLSKSCNLDFISYYSTAWNKMSDDGETLNSAYGARIYGNGNHASRFVHFNQYNHVIELLKADKHSRQAVIHIKTPSCKKTKDEVCTLSLQFLIRESIIPEKSELHCITNMRSNDLKWGSPYDIYFFTFLQEQIYNRLCMQYPDLLLGNYFHNAASLHIYNRDANMFRDILTDKTIDSERSNFDSEDITGYIDDVQIDRFLDIEKTIRLSDDNKLLEEIVHNAILLYQQNVKRSIVHNAIFLYQQNVKRSKTAEIQTGERAILNMILVLVCFKYFKADKLFSTKLASDFFHKYKNLFSDQYQVLINQYLRG